MTLNGKCENWKIGKCNYYLLYFPRHKNPVNGTSSAVIFFVAGLHYYYESDVASHSYTFHSLFNKPRNHLYPLITIIRDKQL